MDPSSVGLGLEVDEGRADDGGEVDGSRSFSPLSLLARVRRASISRACSSFEASTSSAVERHVGDRRVGVVERNLQEGALGGEGGAKLVGGVGDEVTLRVERRVEPPEQVVEGVAEFLQLVLRAVEGQALVQVGRGDPSGRAGDGPDGSQHPAGNEPAGEEGEDGHDGEGDSRVDEKLV